MKILETVWKNRLGVDFTLVMTEGSANDVAVYEYRGDVAPSVAAEKGVKMTERNALLAGFSIPEGKHYRR